MTYRADHFTALLDACVLAGVLKRNLLLSLAEAELFRPRWSEPILDEMERAIDRMTRCHTGWRPAAYRRVAEGRDRSSAAEA